MYITPYPYHTLDTAYHTLPTLHFLTYCCALSASSSRSISNEAFQDAFADNNNASSSSRSSAKSNEGMQLNATSSAVNNATPTTAATAYPRTTSMNSVASTGSAGSKGSGTGPAVASKTAAAPSGEDFFANFGV